FMVGSVIEGRVEQRELSLPMAEAGAVWGWSVGEGETRALLRWATAPATARFYSQDLTPGAGAEPLSLAGQVRGMWRLPKRHGVVFEAELAHAPGRCLLALWFPEEGVELQPVREVYCGADLKVSPGYDEVFVLVEPVAPDASEVVVRVLSRATFQPLLTLPAVR